MREGDENMRKRIHFFEIIISIIAAIAVIFATLYNSLLKTNMTIDVTNYAPCLQENLSANSKPELLYDGQHLYKLGKMTWFGFRCLRAMDVRDMSEAVPEEMTDGVVFKNQILYIDRSNHVLYLFDRKNRKKTVLCENAASFQFGNKNVYCLLMDGTLLCYDTEQGTSEAMQTNVCAFTLDDEKLWYVEELDSSTDKNVTYRIQCDGEQAAREITLKCRVQSILSCGSYLVLPEKRYAGIHVLDKYSDKQYTLLEDVRGQAQTAVNFSMPYLYVSYAVSELEDPHDIASVNLKDYGTYCYNIHDLTWAKLCDESFEKLYVFGDEILWGQDTHGKFTKISTLQETHNLITEN